MLRLTIVTTIVSLATPSSGCINGHLADDEFAVDRQDEHDARERIQHWIGQAETLLQDPTITAESKAEVRTAIAQTRSALAAYDELRERGAYRGAIMAPLRLSAAGIVADDATGVGVANDVFLIPVALAAIATYVITDPPASQEDLGRAWNRVLQRSGDLGARIDILLLAAPGNVADTGIMEEARALVAAGEAGDICEALQLMMDRATEARRQQRIKRTQKAKGCRHSRHSRK